MHLSGSRRPSGKKIRGPAICSRPPISIWHSIYGAHSMYNASLLKSAPWLVIHMVDGIDLFDKRTDTAALSMGQPAHGRQDTVLLISIKPFAGGNQGLIQRRLADERNFCDHLSHHFACGSASSDKSGLDRGLAAVFHLCVGGGIQLPVCNGHAVEFFGDVGQVRRFKALLQQHLQCVRRAKTTP